MSDLTKGYGAVPEAAGRPGDAWLLSDSDAAEMDRWMAFMRGDEPSSRRAAPQAKKQRGLIGLRKKGRHQLSSS